MSRRSLKLVSGVIGVAVSLAIWQVWVRAREGRLWTPHGVLWVGMTVRDVENVFGRQMTSYQKDGHGFSEVKCFGRSQSVFSLGRPKRVFLRSNDYSDPYLSVARWQFEDSDVLVVLDQNHRVVTVSTQVDSRTQQ